MRKTEAMALVVNGQTVSQDLIEAEIAALSQQLAVSGEYSVESIGSLASEWALDNVIEKVLLQQAAARLASEETDASKQLERLLNTLASEVDPPKRRDIVDFYNGHRDRFRVPETFHVSHVVKNVDEQHAASDALVAIQNAQADLARGEPFTQVADRYSDCPGSGGELALFPTGEMVEEFESVIAGLKPGQLSPIFRTRFGYHIAKLHARNPARIRPLSEVYSQIESEMLAERRQQAIGNYLDRLRAESTVEVQEKELHQTGMHSKER